MCVCIGDATNIVSLCGHHHLITNITNITNIIIIIIKVNIKGAGEMSCGTG